jgi:malonyl-CoA O-methyltransferase
MMEVEQAVMLQLLPSMTGLSALDAGCGSGRYLQLLADRGARVVGVDQSDEMLRRARKIGPAVRADLSALPIRSGSLDVVVSGLALGDIADLNAAIREFARVLKPGGLAIYSVVHPRGGDEGWQRTFETPRGTFAVDAYWHSQREHESACAAAGLAIDETHEPDMMALVIRCSLRAR